ncbi:XRE family transcriptional regulator [Streptomyces sp. NPDC001667]
MNTRLRTMMIQCGVSQDELAERCGVIPKSVQRWITQGRVPHQRHRFIVCQELGVEESYLWPNTDRWAEDATRAELIQTYADRASVPRDVWLSLLTGAKANIDVLVFSGTFYAQTNPRIAVMLAERADEGVSVRLCFGDPDGAAIAQRGEEEGIGDTLGAKVRASLTYYRALVAHAGCEVRLHDTTLYNSLFRYDDNLLVNPHVWGRPASANPLFHIQRCGEGWFDNYVGSFDAVWNTAKPWNPESGV